MRIGLVEFLLILAIGSLTVGPQLALFVDRWMRRANRANARAARRRAEYAAQMAAERDALLKRFRTASTVFGVVILLALVYAAAYDGASLKKRKSDLVRTDGGHYAAILSVDGELTGFDFDADGDLWLAVLTTEGGSLCRARHDSWGAAVEQVVAQIDGAPLGAISAVTVGPDGRVYFAIVGDEPASAGLESTLRTALLAHTGTGWVYVYDPADRSVQRVLGGIAGASGLALSTDGSTLYVSDLGSRCVWQVNADARELTAGGKNCQSFVSGLPGYPGALAVDEDDTLYISYRWARSEWLEKHADGTLLRGVALRAGENLQEKLFSLPADAPCAEAVSLQTGRWKTTFTGKALEGCTAVCPVESKVYFGAAGEADLPFARV